MASLDVIADGKERRFHLKDDVVSIGREISCTVPVQDEKASRKHCRIEREGLHWIVEDLESHNGTYLNEIQFKGKKRLANGDVIRIGHTWIYFRDTIHPLAWTWAFLTSPLFIRWSIITIMVGTLAFFGYAMISTMNMITQQKDREAGMPEWKRRGAIEENGEGPKKEEKKDDPKKGGKRE